MNFSYLDISWLAMIRKITPMRKYYYTWGKSNKTKTVDSLKVKPRRTPKGKVVQWEMARYNQNFRFESFWCAQLGVGANLTLGDLWVELEIAL